MLKATLWSRRLILEEKPPDTNLETTLIALTNPNYQLISFLGKAESLNILNDSTCYSFKFQKVLPSVRQSEMNLDECRRQ